MCPSGMEDRSWLMGKNTENVPGPSHLYQHTDKSDPAESSSVAYTHLSIL